MVEPDFPSSAELGYWFLREAWGKGYATESSAAMLELGFRRLGFHRVWGKCHTQNVASAKVMEKLGMTYEGTLREHVWLRDHFRSSRIYGMLEGEYSAAPRVYSSTSRISANSSRR
jgi:[ribosomal protein S5]-alanine N-acetyltransferase